MEPLFFLDFTMKFGKLYDLKGVDFSLPPDPPQTERVLSRYKDSSYEPKVYLGATGWGNKEWLGKWYPSKTKQNEFLRHYARQFGTIEFNTTHYRIPNAETVARWHELSTSEFKFCPKLPQQISHYQRLKGAYESTTAFLTSINGLQEKLGAVFMQMPENYGPNQTENLLSYCQDWPQDLPIGVELRHPEFFDRSTNETTLFEGLEAARQGTVITDVSGRRDVLHMRLTNPILILRFVGNGLHPTDYTRADAWARRLKSWMDQGLRDAYLFIHQPDMEQVPDYSIYWAEAIERECGVKVVRPVLVDEARQGTLF